LFERNDDELGVSKVSLEHPADVLGVTQIQGRVYFVQDVHGCWLEEEQ